MIKIILFYYSPLTKRVEYTYTNQRTKSKVLKLNFVDHILYTSINLLYASMSTNIILT